MWVKWATHFTLICVLGVKRAFFLGGQNDIISFLNIKTLNEESELTLARYIHNQNHQIISK